MYIRLAVISVLTLAVAAGCSSNNATTAPSTLASTGPSAEGSAQWWENMTHPLGGQGQLTGKVYTVIVPRPDLWVQSEMGDIPTEAGISSKFYFYKCDCGMMKVIGEFVLPDYEANDVIDALRAGQFKIASMSPILMNEKPYLISIRFQAEDHSTEMLIKTIHSALDWTGPMRSSTRPQS